MTHPEILLELARVPDAAEIALMSRELIEEGLRWSWTPSRVARSIRSPRANVVVTRVGDRIAGFGIMRYGDDEAHLDLLGVGRSYRRAGLGWRLMEWLEKPAREGGIAAVVLEVRECNDGAQAFYEWLGYHKVESIAGYYQGSETAVRMRRALGPRPTPIR